MSLVLDASAVIDILVSTHRRHVALQAMAGHELYAPQIIDLEVLSALARLERPGNVERTQSDRAFQDWRALALERTDHQLLTSVKDVTITLLT